MFMSGRDCEIVIGGFFLLQFFFGLNLKCVPPVCVCVCVCNPLLNSNFLFLTTISKELVMY